MISLRLGLAFLVLVLVIPAHAAPGLGEDCLRKRSQQGACSTFFDERDGREKEYACKGDSQSGICELPAMQNEKCTAYAGHRDCDIGLDCFGSFTCQMASKMGDSCQVGSSDLYETCGSLGRCVDGVCVPLLGEGEGFCGEENNYSFMNCESHLHCDSQNTGTCVPRKEIDGDCWGSQDCVPGTWCNQYTCVGQASEGSYCEESYGCAGILVCQQNICRGNGAIESTRESVIGPTQGPVEGAVGDDDIDATPAMSAASPTSAASGQSGGGGGSSGGGGLPMWLEIIFAVIGIVIAIIGIVVTVGIARGYCNAQQQPKTPEEP